jgi:hypothetical protein
MTCDQGTGSSWLAMATDPLLWAIIMLGVTVLVLIFVSVRAQLQPAPVINVITRDQAPTVTAGSVLRRL